MTATQALSLLQTGETIQIQQVIQEYEQNPQPLAGLVETIKKLWRKCVKAKINDRQALERFGWTDMAFSHKKINKLPEEIGLFQALHQLTISNDQLQELPSTIFELHQLERLDLSHNQIVEVEEAIGDLQNLAYIDLSHNQLQRLPQRIAQLPLVSLNVANNQLQQLPLSLKSCTQLQDIYVSGNPLPKSLLKEWQRTLPQTRWHV